MRESSPGMFPESNAASRADAGKFHSEWRLIAARLRERFPHKTAAELAVRAQLSVSAAERFLSSGALSGDALLALLRSDVSDLVFEAAVTGAKAPTVRGVLRQFSISKARADVERGLARIRELEQADARAALATED